MKQILVGELAQHAKEVLQRIADEYGMRVGIVNSIEVIEDHVNVFWEAPPSYSRAEVVQSKMS